MQRRGNGRGVVVAPAGSRCAYFKRRRARTATEPNKAAASSVMVAGSGSCWIAIPAIVRPLPMRPMSVAAPVVRLMLNKLEHALVVGVSEAKARLSKKMSNPTRPLISNPGLRLPTVFSVPSLGFNRKCWSASLASRIRSRTGLKSKPSEVPFNANPPAESIAVALPLVRLIV